jgi:hypothetical protein
LGLLLWESVQPVVEGATFDWGDVSATLFGGIVWLMMWFLLRPNRHLVTVQES